MYQEITIIGIIGKDPEKRVTNSGKSMTTISVATSRALGQGQKETTWFRVTAWDKSADYLEKYARKGAKILCRGRLVCDAATGGPRTYTRNDGSIAASFEVVAEVVKLLDYNNGNSQQSGQQSYQQPQQAQQRQQTQAQPMQFAESEYQEEIPW